MYEQLCHSVRVSPVPSLVYILPPYFRHLLIFFLNLGKVGCATTPTARIVTLSRVARAGAVRILTGKTSAF